MSCRILITEDEPKCRRLVAQFLQRSGFEVTAIQEGMGFIEAMQNGCQPDVIVLSWELPFDESEAILEWLQYQEIVDIPIVVLTAGFVSDTAQWESALPGLTWLHRPFKLHELLDVVQNAARVSRAELLWRHSKQSQFSHATTLNVGD